jgi:3-oxoacyl-[acyl-carrier protein] reductase
MQYAIITGASRGIGAELVKKFTSDKICVFAISRNADRLNKLRQSLPDPQLCLPVSADLSDPLQIEKVVEQIKTKTQRIDYLVNNASILINQPLQDFSFRQIQDIYSHNVFSTIYLTEKILPFLGREATSHVINISSMGGFQGSVKFPGLSVYASTKAAVANLAEGWAAEWADKNIKVNSLALGAVQTEMLLEAFPDYAGGVKPEQMAGFIYDFATKAHQHINGKIIPVSISTP